MITFIWVVHIAVAIGLVGLVMVQRGKGADVGAAFGSGASTTVFGSQGSATFLSRATAVLATIFFITSLTLTMMLGKKVEKKSVVETAPAVEVPAPSSSPAPSRPADVPELPPGGPAK